MSHEHAIDNGLALEDEESWSPQQQAAYLASTRAEWGTRQAGRVISWHSLASAQAYAATPGGKRLGAVVVFRLPGGEWTDFRPTPAAPTLPAQIAAIERAVPGLQRQRDVRALVGRGADGRFAGADAE